MAIDGGPVFPVPIVKEGSTVVDVEGNVLAIDSLSIRDLAILMFIQGHNANPDYLKSEETLQREAERQAKLFLDSRAKFYCTNPKES